MSPEAGWYPDPSDSRQLRWWDGAAWTQSRMPAADARPPEPSQVGGAARPPTVSTQWVPADSSGLSYRLVPMTPSGQPLAHQGARLAARLIDWALLGVLQWVLLSPWRGAYDEALRRYLDSMQNGLPDPYLLLDAPGYQRYATISVVLGLLLTGLYEVLMVRHGGATLGKKLFRIKVVAADGGRVGWLAGIGRWALVYPLAQLTCYLFRLVDGAWCLFDAERSCLHDKMVRTHVITSRG